MTPETRKHLIDALERAKSPFSNILFDLRAAASRYGFSDGEEYQDALEEIENFEQSIGTRIYYLKKDGQS